jgi:hypothetical protein
MEIRYFASDDEFLEYYRRLEEDVRHAGTTEQRQITYGDHWASWRPDFDLWIFGRVSTREELEEGASRAGADADEVRYERELETRSFANGYRFGWAYSIACADGEMGSTHVSWICAKLTPEQFDEAQNAGWSVQQLVADGRRWARILFSRRSWPSSSSGAAGCRPGGATKVPARTVVSGQGPPDPPRGRRHPYSSPQRLSRWRR